MKQWSRRRIVVLAGLAVAICWLGASAWLVWSARSAMENGADGLRSVRRDASIASLTEPESRQDVAAAQGHFDEAAGDLGSPILAPFRPVPVLGRHLGAARDLARAAEDGTRTAVDALDDLLALTERPRATGAARVETINELASVASGVDEALSKIDPGSPDALFGPLGDAIAEMGEQRVDAREAAQQLEATSLALADVLDGPEPYLLLGANNAEMRHGSGMFLSAAEVRFSGGSMTLGEVVPTADLVLAAGTVPVSGDLAENWPWLDPGRDLRNLGLTADFPQSAAVAVQTWAATSAASGTQLGGVISLDVDAIRSLLRVVGPVEVDGIEYTADDVRGELLRDQYQRFDGAQGERRDQLGSVARVIFERLESGDWELADLATEMVDLVAGRHMLIWSSDARVQDAWAAVHADGHLEANSVAVGLLNRGGTKLDSWVETVADLEVSAPTNGRATLTITYEVANTSPGSGSAYVVGPNVEGLEPGDHRALVVVNVPAGSTDVQIDGATPFLLGGDGPTVVIGGEVTVAPGASTVVTVQALLPEGLADLMVEPSARIPHTDWVMGSTPRDRDRRQTMPIPTS